ncbi:MAG: lysine--tRNA ligase [Parcubacteria group bacterium RIFCSPLOWO2_01_FULL_48_18]|nr:MAG: lysine--tRNA ligase [Parcubacteria group bacterium RIFCSPLOWO2_01_FULL_48_18]OHB23994.1 MAG: lysine--tRNA ligase [Parcubacteria group bacterium RIFCSPHIGHO2_02_FULL_48_10b]
MGRIEELIDERKAKLEALRASGADPYPARVAGGTAIETVLDRFTSWHRQKKIIVVNARVMGIRKQGGLIFLDLLENRARLQALFKKDKVKNFSVLKENLDIGDFVSVKGTLFLTKSGEKTLGARSAVLIVKSLRPLPATWYGLKDAEERYRRRYLDFLLNAEAAAPIERRSEIVLAIREVLDGEGFREFETPILQAVAGGATARPFETHSNALDRKLFLRVAPELYLKRLLVAGWEKVYELGKDFRNEGVDREHNPEFTMLELYWAYQDYSSLMKFVEKALAALLKKLSVKKLFYQGRPVRMKAPWPRVSFADVIKKYSGIDIYAASSDDVRQFLSKNNIAFDNRLAKYELADEIFKKVARPFIFDPLLVINHPKEISPLAKARPENPEETERFQLVMCGMEIVNGFSELNDPIDQRMRMELQEKLYRAGHPEVSRLDEDFIEALEYGMPPAAGLGIGIDRLVAILTDSHSIKDVMAFPLMKPKQ